MISVLKALGSAVLVGAGVKAGGDLYQALRHRVSRDDAGSEPDVVDAEVTRRGDGGPAKEAAAPAPRAAGPREADLEAERDRIDAQRARVDTELDRLRRKREKQAKRRGPAKA